MLRKRILYFSGWLLNKPLFCLGHDSWTSYWQLWVAFVSTQTTDPGYVYSESNSDRERATNRKHDRSWRVWQQSIQCGSTEEEVASSAWKGMNKCVSINPMSLFNKTDFVILHKLARFEIYLRAKKNMLFVYFSF